MHFRAGFAQMDITPEPGRVTLGAGPSARAAQGVRDRLSAAALALGGAGGEAGVTVVALDSAGVDAAAHARIHAACAGPGDRVILCCSHGQGAPFLAEGPTVDADYLGQVAARASAAARQARSAMVPARLGWGRRALDTPPWGGRSPGGPADGRLHLLRIERAQSGREPICALWSLACRPSALGPGNGQVSADLVGAVRGGLPWPSLFLQGFAADQEPRDVGEGALAAWDAVAEVLAALWRSTPTAPAGALALADGTCPLPGAGGGPRAAEIVALRLHNGRAAFWPGGPPAHLGRALPADCLPVGYAGVVPGDPPGADPEAGEALLAATRTLLAGLNG